MSRHAKLLQRSNELGVGSIVVSTVGFERIMGAPFRLVEPDSMPDEQEASVEWLQGHVRAAAQETFRSFAHIGSEHVDQVARSVLTDPASYESSSDGVPCVKSHAQLASLMVKYSFSNRLRHLSRALPKEIVGDVLKDVEKLTVATYEGLLGDDLQFDEILSRRVILPNRLGGIAMGSSPCADAAYVAASAKMEGFVVTSDFFSAARALLSEHIEGRENSGSYRAPGFYEDALREACDVVNAAAASNSTLIDKDPERKEDDDGNIMAAPSPVDNSGAVWTAPAPLAPFAHLYQAPLSQKELSEPLWNGFYNSTVLMARGVTDQTTRDLHPHAARRRKHQLRLRVLCVFDPQLPFHAFLVAGIRHGAA